MRKIRLTRWVNALTIMSVSLCFSTTDSDIDRQFNVSESKLGSEGIGPQYVDDYSTPDDELAAYIDVIIFAGDTHQLEHCKNGPL